MRSWKCSAVLASRLNWRSVDQLMLRWIPGRDSREVFSWNQYVTGGEVVGNLGFRGVTFVFSYLQEILSCRSPPVCKGKPVDRAGTSTLILDRDLLHVVDNHNVAETFFRIELQAELILDSAYEGRAGRSVVGQLFDQVSPARSFQKPSHIDVPRHIDVVLPPKPGGVDRSEEHTSELQSLRHLVCRLLLEKKSKATTH